FAPHDSGVVPGHVQRLWRRNYEILEGLYVSHAHRALLDPGKVLLRLDEFRRQVQLVIRPGSEPSRQHHRRLADRHRPLAPVQQVAAAQVLAELAGVLRAAGERLHFRRRRRLGSDEDRENIDAGREADCRGRGVRDGQQYELLHCDLGDAMTGTILNSIRSLHMRANSVKAAAVSLSSKSNPPAEIGGRPATQELDSFGWLASGLLESRDRLVPPLCLWFQGEGQHEFHEHLLSITFLPSRAPWDDAQRLGRCRQTGARRRPTAPRLRSPWL